MSFDDARKILTGSIRRHRILQARQLRDLTTRSLDCHSVHAAGRVVQQYNAFSRVRRSTALAGSSNLNKYVVQNARRPLSDVG